jgi:hypothetical protein
MGYNTDYLGHIDIEPPLNEAEIEYLTAFCASRRFDRPGGAYEVPGNPAAETSDGIDVDRYNACAPGQPDLWCNWSVCWDGCCLTWSGTEKSYSMIEWLRYLIAHFLRPGAHTADDPRFTDFTFDHRLAGMVVGCRRGTKELFAVAVSDNRVRTRTLRPPDPRYVDLPPLPYEEQIDRENESVRRRRRRPRDGDAQVLEIDPARARR